MRVAVTGPKGRLASWLIAHYGCTPLDCDISKFDETRIEIQRAEPDAIINCAAYTDVDRAEQEMEKALLANVRGAGNVRMAFSGPMVHLSTSYVFHGGDGHYSEYVTPSPLNNYGFTKWGGEAAVRSGGDENCLIVRTVSLFGNGPKPDFVSSILSRLRNGRSLALPDNLTSNPTYIPHLAKQLIWALEHGVTGVLNLAGTDVVSRYAWGREIARVFKIGQSLISPTSVIKGEAPRPRRATLNLSKAKKLGVPMFSLDEGLKELKQWDDQRSTSHP